MVDTGFPLNGGKKILYPEWNFENLFFEKWQFGKKIF